MLTMFQRSIHRIQIHKLIISIHWWHIDDTQMIHPHIENEKCIHTDHIKNIYRKSIQTGICTEKENVICQWVKIFCAHCTLYSRCMLYNVELSPRRLMCKWIPPYHDDWWNTMWKYTSPWLRYVRYRSPWLMISQMMSPSWGSASWSRCSVCTSKPYTMNMWKFWWTGCHDAMLEWHVHVYDCDWVCMCSCVV